MKLIRDAPGTSPQPQKRCQGAELFETQKGHISMSLLHPNCTSPIPTKSFGMNGGDDGARTRDLCRDSPPFWRNSLKPGVMDGNLMRPEEPFGTVIVPLMCPRSIFDDLCPTPLPESISGRDPTDVERIYHKESGRTKRDFCPGSAEVAGPSWKAARTDGKLASGSPTLEVEQC